MELRINGIFAELGDSMPAITKKSVDINNPFDRFIDYSNQFLLPDTTLNRKILGHPQKIASNNRSYDRVYNVEIVDEFIIFRGKGILTGYSNFKYKFQIVDRSRDLFDFLKQPLNRVDWDDKDLTLMQTSIDANDTADNSTCWIWGKACYHEIPLQVNTDQTTGDPRCKYSRPAFYLQGLVKRACSNFGYTFLDNGIQLAISSNHDQFFFTSYQKTLSTTYDVSSSLNISGLNSNDFETDVTTASTTIDIGTTKTKFRFRGAVNSNAIITLTVKATDKTDGTKIQQSKTTLNTSTSNIDFETSEFHSDNGMTVEFIFSGTGGVTFTDVVLYSLCPEGEKDLSTNPWLNYKIKVHDNLPKDLTYSDLFKLICVTQNRIPLIDNDKKTLSFIDMSKLNKLNSVDWSDKFIIDSEKVSNNYEGLAKKNYLKYDNDLTVNPDLGSDFFEVENEILEDENDYINLNFSASNETSINSNDIAHVKIYTDTARQEVDEIKIRLFKINGSNLEFNGIDWEVLKSLYYVNLLNSLKRVRVIECEMYLSKLDFKKWNPLQLAYIDYFESTFMVLEISNFSPEKLTKVKLFNYGR